MCGICGFNGSFQKDLLQQMNDQIRHRGPDDEGTHFDPSQKIGLGHRRLSIIDLSPKGHQPMWDNQKKAIIAFNGEIYNYKELQKQLNEKGYQFNSNTDTEVLLNLYLEYGPDLLKQLKGIYAFALWDVEKKQLFVARDELGIKPLYYSQTPEGFLFSSELKSLLRGPIDRSLNPHALMYHLNYLWSPAPNTLFKSIHKLEPGHALLIQDGKIRKKWQFYDLPYDQPIEPLSIPDAIKKTHDHVRTAVHRQMVADVQVGAFLSGGLDSSAIVAFAKETLPAGQKLPCFTIDFSSDEAIHEGQVQDLPYAEKVAKHLGVDLHKIVVNSSIIDHLEKMIYHLDEPQGDPAPLNVMLISQLAKENGIKVLLSGAGGDDIFTGYRRHYALAKEKYWAWLPASIRKSIQESSQKLGSRSSLLRRVSKALQHAHLDEKHRLVGYFSWMAEERMMELFSTNFRAQLGKAPVSLPLLRSLDALPKDTPALNQMLYLEAKHFLADHNLNYTDKMSMAEGVEVRVPLLDVDLIRFATTLPLDYKQRGSVGKWIFKKAMEPHLPHDVIYRPKTGFGAPIRYWLKNELKPLVQTLLSPESIKQRDLFDPLAVQNLIKNDASGRMDASYTIFALLCLEIWFRQFVDQPLKLSA